MSEHTHTAFSGGRAAIRRVAQLLTGLLCLAAMSAGAVTIRVKGPGASEYVGSFRYTIELDSTYHVVPDVTGLSGNPDADPTLALAFHRSAMKVVKVGHVTNGVLEFDRPDPNARYFVSVMPDNEGINNDPPVGYTMSGRAIPTDAAEVVVPVNPVPIRTAQVSVLVFEDSNPINNEPDAMGDQERGLCGFEVQLFEAGGTYGASGGRMSTDTFGNPLGTEYALNADGTPRYNPDGSLMISRLGANELWTDANGTVRIKNLSPAKYTLYAVPPAEKPSLSRCHFADAPNVPIYVDTPAQRTRPDQIVWNNGFELPADPVEGNAMKWHQTTTIEGTWGTDAWVKSGEPTFFKEFGPPGHHVFIGFTRRFKDTSATGLNGPATVTGTVRSVHMSRPPTMRFHSGSPMTACWVGINEVTAGVGIGRGLYANACNPDGTFSISGLKRGQRYQLVVWDEPLDNVFANYEFSVPLVGSTTVALGDVPVFDWFSHLQGKVFYDTDASGFPYDANGKPKKGIPNSILNIRFRDGSIYQSTVTDDDGNYYFPEFFPFFNWMVAETDFTRFRSTGATIVADNGGPVVEPDPLYPTLWPASTLAPQMVNGKPWRIFGGSDDPTLPSSGILLQAVQGFLGQYNIIHWGKKEYDPSDPNAHGGITGVVHYASTRAEFDPKFATPENNEPGIPGVEIRLYRLNAQNKVVDPQTGALVEPKDANAQHAVQIVRTDAWDDAVPEKCHDPAPYTDRTGHSFANGDGTSRCIDGMRTWNQVRDGVFDGGFAFVDYCPAGVAQEGQCNPDPQRGGSTDPVPLPPGRYMTEGVAPYGYEHQKEEDKNVDFGDLLVPGTLANPVDCLGSRDEGLDGEGNPIPPLVPEELTAFPGVEIPARFRDVLDGNGNVIQRRPYCNKKLVVVAPGMNPFSDFHMFARVPVAGHIVGMILDDLANEFDPYAPNFGEKYAPPFMPISIRDYAGNEINRVYSDRYGTYNALVPSTFSYNVPLPSGVSPNMVNVCLNSPTMKDANGNTVLDPHYNPQYSQYCYTFQYLPGKTTYLDTPVLPVAAFAGPSQYALDCEQPEATPGIKLVTGLQPVGGVGEPGPWIPNVAGQRRIRIESMGMTRVSNPQYDQTNLGNPGDPTVAPKTIQRDYGFGNTPGKVLVGGTELLASGIVTWTDGTIVADVPLGMAGTVEVVHANGRKSVRGVALHSGTVNMPAGRPITVGPGAAYAHRTIQAAIDAAADGDLITVAPGLYEEAPIVWKRVRVQGYGAPATIVNASVGPDYLRQQAWREKVCDLLLNRGMSAALLPGQTVPADMNACLTGDTADNAPLVFASEESSGFFVLQRPIGANASNQAFARGPFVSTNPVRALQIDGFTVTGADTGGGIVANGNAVQLQLSNNRITGNQGLYSGGIRIGHADLINGDGPTASNSPLVNIHHNEILKNGNLAGETTGGGGGISIYTGANGYRVAQNYVCGNFSTGDGGGMAHNGVSTTLRVTNVTNAQLANYVDQDNRARNVNGNNNLEFASTVSDNVFLFNQSFSQMKSVQGGGIAITGVVDPVANNGLSLGTGNVTVVNNTIQGNLAGAGDGGGIALVGVNGAEIFNANTANWYRVDLLNNVIVNNGAGVAGGGVSLQDAPNVNIVNNTIALNDSYATAARAFANGDPTQAQNQPPGPARIAESQVQNGAGIAAYGHSSALQGVVPGNAILGDKRYFSDASIVNTVVLGNRRYHWRIDYNVDQGSTNCAYDTTGVNACFGLLGPEPADASGNDIAVLISPVANAQLKPAYSVFTSLHSGAGSDGTGVSGRNNRAGTPNDFASAYANGSNGALKQVIAAVEQSVTKGAPVLEVQEPTTATTAAAFDEGGNFIDVRFGPLTRGSVVAGVWKDFGLYNPTNGALTTDFSLGLSSVGSTWPKLLTDRNGVARSASNWIRGALAQ